MATSDYKLTIGSNSFVLNKETSITGFGKVTLTKLSFDKGIYRPAKIEATFSVPSTTTYSTIKDLFFEENITKNRRRVSLNYKEGTTEKAIASNYYVYKFMPIFSKTSSSTTNSVELIIYSEDMLMTLDKYSEAFTGKKLGKDIFAKRVKDFKFVERQFKTNTDGTIVTENDVPVLDSKTKDISISTNADTVSSNLQVISFTDSTTNQKNEFIQPYLVQYNESFYDFLKRTANRCGEFLYHENGKLYLGMDVKDKTADTYTFAADASSYYFEDTAEDSLGYDSYGYDYMNLKTTSSLNYNDPLATDEYLDKIDKKYTDYASELIDVRRNLPGYVFDALKATSIGEAIANFGMTIAGNVLSAGINLATKNYNNKKENIKPWEDDNERWNGDQLRQFGTGVDHTTSVSTTSTTNLYASFYEIIRKRQKEVGKTVLILKFETSLQDLKIGDKIKVDNLNYLVIGVKGSLEYASNKYVVQQEVKAIPFYESGTGTITYTPIPPKQSDVSIRESEPQHAIVTENLDPQKLGRVRVRFVWQQSSKDSTPWIRMTIPFASDGGAIKFVPEKGDEVMVSFIDGNVEHPYVTGALLNNKCNKSWSALPDRTITSKNGHSITFDDDSGGAQFFTNMIPFIGGLRSFIPSDLFPWTFDFQETRSLVGGTTISDRYGFYKIEMNSATRSININSPLGDISLNAFTGISINAPNGDISIKGKNVSIEAANKVNITSGSNIKNRFFADSGLDRSKRSNTDLFLQSAGRTAFQALYDGSRTFYDALISKFLDLTLFRTFLEIFMRPIDGTTSIKSFTFVQVEAGKGSVDYPYDSYRKSKTEDVADYVKLQESISFISTQVNSRINSIKDAYQKLCTAIKDFADMSGAAETMLNKDEIVISFDTIKKKGWDDKKSDFDEKEFKFDDKKLVIEKYDEDEVISKVKTETGMQEKPDINKFTKDTKNIYFQDLQKWDASYNKYSAEAKAKIALVSESQQDQVKDMAKGLAAAFVTLEKCFEDLSLPANNNIFKDEVQTALNTIFTELIGDAGILKDIYDKKPDKNTQEDKSINWDDISKKYRRKAVFKLVGDAKIADLDKVKLKATYNQATDVTDDNAWKSLVESWITEVSPATVPTGTLDFASNLFKGIYKDWPTETFLDPWKDATVNRRRWATGANGKILLSDTPNKTISFDAKGASAANNNLIISEKSVTDIINSIKAI